MSDTDWRADAPHVFALALRARPARDPELFLRLSQFLPIDFFEFLRSIRDDVLVFPEGATWLTVRISANSPKIAS